MVMDWLNGATEQQIVVGKAIRIADQLTLPFHAWSKTRAEVKRPARRLFVGTVILIVAVTAPIVWSLRNELEKEPWPAFAFVGAMALAGGLLMLLTWSGVRQAGEYRDPEIMIGVGEHGLSVRSPDRTQAIYWNEIEARLLLFGGKSSLQFRGIEMTTSQGTIRLEDEWYRNGALAAAVVVREVHAAHEARQKARIERIG
jgi:hypothetical protein